MKLKYVLIILIVLVLGAAGAFWYYFMQNGTPDMNDPLETPLGQGGGFIPLDRSVSPTPSISASQTPIASSSEPTPEPTVIRQPKLRQLSKTPVGGYGASTTEDATIVRWADRGRGNIYELDLAESDIQTISNTIVPRIIQSVWNKNLSGYIGSLLSDSTDAITTVYAELRPQTATGSAPYTLRGKNLPENTIAYAVSPKKDRLYLFLNENGTGVGYLSAFDGGKLTKLMSTPLTQVVVEWPEDNTISLTTKASAGQDGYLYFINAKTGAIKKVLGPLRGLTTKTSHDAQNVLASYVTAQGNLRTFVQNTAKNTATDAGFLTITDKCAWGNFYKEVVFCGIPPRIESAVYPDDWHFGTLSFSDKLWQYSTETEELQLISSLTQDAKQTIDAYRLELDPQDNYLFFMNKNDLSLWSVDLISTQ
jgi:hypothetical protein